MKHKKDRYNCYTLFFIGQDNVGWASVLLFSHAQPLTTGSHNCENHTVVTVFWRNCPGKWPQLLEAYGDFIFRTKNLSCNIFSWGGEVWPLPEGSEDIFYLQSIPSGSLGHCIIYFSLTFKWFVYTLY